MDNHYHQPLPLSAIGALALGHKVDAINIVRQETALSLKEAKAMVEAYEQANPDLRPLTHQSHLHISLWLSSAVIFIAAACLMWVYLSVH